MLILHLILANQYKRIYLHTNRMNYTTLKDIAKASGKSIGTVSRVLRMNDDEGYKISKETKEMILDLAHKMGYTPNIMARNLQGNRNPALGFILPDFGNPIANLIGAEVGKAAYKKKCSLILGMSFGKWNIEKKIIEQFFTMRLSGLLIIPSQEKQNKNYLYLEEISRRGFPVVVLGDYKKQYSLHYITSNDRKAVYDLVGVFVKNSIKKMIFMGGGDFFYDARERIEGFRQGLLDNGLKFRKESVIPGVWDMNTTEPFIPDLVSRIRKEKIQAVICYGAHIASAVIRGLNEAGIQVPADVQVTGFANSIICKYGNPQLTSIDQGWKGQAEYALKLLPRLIKGESLPRSHTKIPCSIVIRKSALI